MTRESPIFYVGKVFVLGVPAAMAALQLWIGKTQPIGGRMVLVIPLLGAAALVFRQILVRGGELPSAATYYAGATGGVALALVCCGALVVRFGIGEWSFQAKAVLLFAVNLVVGILTGFLIFFLPFTKCC